MWEIHMVPKLGNGRYHLLRLCRVDEISYSYLAYDELRQEKVMVEVLHPKYAAKKLLRIQFLRDIEIANLLKVDGAYHPIDFESSKEICYKVWSKTDLVSLEDYIQSHGKLSEQEAIDITYQLASILERIHEEGWIVRNLSARNVLYHPKQPLVLKGLGFAKHTDETKQLITPRAKQLPIAVHYLSPEQLSREEATKQSDLYSLGVILYYILTRHFPVQGELPSKKIEQFHPNLITLINKLLATDPSKRYSSAQALCNDLHKLQSSNKRPHFWSTHHSGKIAALAFFAISSIVFLTVVNSEDSPPYEQIRPVDWSFRHNLVWKIPITQPDNPISVPAPIQKDTPLPKEKNGNKNPKSQTTKKTPVTEPNDTNISKNPDPPEPLEEPSPKPGADDSEHRSCQTDCYKFFFPF